MLVVFEGLDGSGKSTLIRKVERELIERGYDVLKVREPDKEIREQVCREDKRLDMQDERVLMEKCHTILQKDVVKLYNGIVISDRSYLYSSLVYQTKSLLDMEVRRAEYLRNFSHPDLVYVLTTSPEICRVRALGNRPDETSAFDKAPIEQYEERYKKYMAMADFPEVRMIDCDADIDAICNEITAMERNRDGREKEEQYTSNL